MNRIFITGDIHGLEDIDTCIEFFENKTDLTKDDYLIICGDAGIVWDGSREDYQVQNRLSNLPITILFVDGNHENFDLLNEYEIEIWNGGKVHFIQDDILHLMRGQIFQIGNYSFFTFGGAHSLDWYRRQEESSWWKEELPTQEEMDEGIVNLEKVQDQVDFIITHTAPFEVLYELGKDVADEEEALTRYFDHIAFDVDFKDWYFGHLHVDEDIDSFHCLFNRVVEFNGK